MTAEDKSIARIAAATGLGYLAAAALAIELTRLSGGIALMWVANGILLPALCYLRPRRWVAPVAACFAACFVATLVLRHSWIAATGFAIANMGEAMIAGYVLRRFGTSRRMLDDVRSVMLFAAMGGVVAPGLAGGVGAVAAHFGFGFAIGPTWLDWWFGHGLGTLIATPIVVLLTLADPMAWRRAGRRERVMLPGVLALVMAISAATFSQDALPLLFAPALPMMIATFASGRVGAAMSLIVIAVIGGAFTVAGHGPVNLISGDDAFQLQFFQLYLGTLFLMALPAAALLAQRRALHLRLRESDAALRLLADNSTDVLLSLDIAGVIRFASPSVRILGGFEPATLVGRNALELIGREHRGIVQRAHLDALAAPETNVTVEYQAWRADGAAAWFETNMRAVLGDDDQVVAVVSAIRDVSHRKSIETQLRLAADTDPLTGLANRRPFLARLDRAIAAAATDGEAVVALLDVDHFKRVNDCYGHAAGDAALVTLAEVFRRELRGADAVARLGGEEFAILLAATDLAVAAATVERLRRAIAAQPILAADAPLFRITASFGLAPVTAGTTAEAILAAADRALYEAKDAGRNQLRIAA